MKTPAATERTAGDPELAWRVLGLLNLYRLVVPSVLVALALLAARFQLLAASPALFTAVAGLVGLAIGSFLNVVIHRLPLVLERQWRARAAELEGRQPAAPTEAYGLVRPRSRCPACQAPIRAVHNVPVVSWLLLHGRCAACGAPISARYPLVELATGAAFAVVAWHFGFGMAAVLGCVFTAYLVALTGIDLDRQLLPDILTVPLLWIGLIASAWFGAGEAPPPAVLGDAVIGAVAGYGFLWLVFHLFRLITGKEGMGYGDFKLFAAIGAWLGWQMLPLVLLLAAFVGAAVGIALMAAHRLGRSVPIPFGPYLAGAAWIALLWGPGLVERYLRFAGLG